MMHHHLQYHAFDSDPGYPSYIGQQIMGVRYEKEAEIEARPKGDHDVTSQLRSFAITRNIALLALPAGPSNINTFYIAIIVRQVRLQTIGGPQADRQEKEVHTRPTCALL
jgi:hypothetical protein